MHSLSDRVEVKSCGQVYPRKGMNQRTPYEHQKKAMECLDQINQESAYKHIGSAPHRQRKNLHRILVAAKERPGSRQKNSMDRTSSDAFGAGCFFFSEFRLCRSAPSYFFFPIPHHIRFCQP